LEDGERKTYAADKRHKWSRDGECFSSDAFQAVLKGTDPHSALTHAAHPDWINHPLPAQGTLSGLVYSMEYASSQGEVTSRVFRLQAVSERWDGQLEVSGHCFLRDEQRSFRPDRILVLRDHKSGKQIPSPADYFKRFLESKATASPEHVSAMNRAKPGLKALLWIAQADRQLDEQEIMLMLDYVAERAAVGGARSADIQWDKELARFWLESTKPTFDEAVGAFARMNQKGAEMKMIQSYVARLQSSGHEPTKKRASKILRVLP